MSRKSHSHSSKKHHHEAEAKVALIQHEKEKSKSSKGDLSLEDMAGATIVLHIGKNGSLITDLTIGGVNLSGAAGPVGDIEGELPGDVEVDVLRSFYRECRRLHKQLEKNRKEGKTEKRRFYTATLSFPDEVKHHRIYPLITEFAKIIAERPGEGIWAVANTRPCKDKDCTKLFERLRREKKLPFGLHFHLLMVTSRRALRSKGIWVNRSGASKDGSRVKDIKGKGSVFDDGLNRIILYHTAAAPHLGIPLKKRVVCRGVLGDMWTKATGWKSMKKRYNPLKGLPECGRDPTDHTEEANTGKKVKAKRICQCGCGESIDHMDIRAKFLNHNHAMRWQRKTEKEEEKKAQKEGKDKAKHQAEKEYKEAQKEEARLAKDLQAQRRQDEEYQRAQNEDMEEAMCGQEQLH